MINLDVGWILYWSYFGGVWGTSQAIKHKAKEISLYEFIMVCLLWVPGVLVVYYEFGKERFGK